MYIKDLQPLQSFTYASDTVYVCESVRVDVAWTSVTYTIPGSSVRNTILARSLSTVKAVF